MPILLDTETVAPHERFDFWIESSDRVVFPCTFQRVDRPAFHGYVHQYLIGPMTVTRVTSAATYVERTWSDIAAHDPDLVHLSVQLAGRTLFSQHGGPTACRPGRWCSTTRRTRSRSTPTGPTTSSSSSARACCSACTGASRVTRLATPLTGDIARTLVAPFVTRLAHGPRRRDRLRERHRPRRERPLPPARAVHGRLPARRRRAARRRTRCSRGSKVHIDEHLGDPDLRPDAIAAAHFVSTRHLQKLFKAEGLTVTDWIRERRLAGCRRDLRDPALRATRRSSRIATRWGLTNPAHFSRLLPRAVRAARRASSARRSGTGRPGATDATRVRVRDKTRARSGV